MAVLNQSQLRNDLPPDDYVLEYLLCARFHDDDDDARGYVTKIWCPPHIVDKLEDPDGVIADKIESYMREAQTAFEQQFGRPPSRSQPGGVETQTAS